MDNVFINSIISLAGIGTIAAVVLYFFARKFKVVEDPLIDEVERILPAANCGGCGCAGCRNFAEALVAQKDLSKLYCPVGGNDLINTLAPVLGIVAVKKEPMVAVLRCNGSKQNTSEKVHYEGAGSCYFAHGLYLGENGCSFSCIGLGDCEISCDFNALHVDPDTGLPVISDVQCVACNACVVACPRNILELRKKGPKNKRIFVSCVNEEKGAVARKNCRVACIGCGICAQQCRFDAITINNHLAYIDFNKCTLCRKCVEPCPTHAILEVNFRLKQKKETVPAGEHKE